MKCSHEEYVTNTIRYEDDYGNEHISYESYYKPTVEDVDLHHYKCIQCNKIFSYSNNAPAITNKTKEKFKKFTKSALQIHK